MMSASWPAAQVKSLCVSPMALPTAAASTTRTAVSRFSARLCTPGEAIERFTDGFTRPLPSALTALAIVASMVLLSRAVRVLPIGTAYAVWVGIGIVGTALGGALLFGESLPPRKIAFLALIVLAIVGLNASPR